MTDVKALMHKDIAGMPAYLWALGLAGGLGVAWWIRGHSSGASADVASPSMDGYDSPTDGTGGAATSEPGFYGTGGDDTTDPGTGTGTAVDTIPDTYDYAGNEGIGVGSGGMTGWRTKAIAALMAGPPRMGYLRASGIVDKALAGKTINARQAAAFDRAVAKVGPPPKATPAPTVKRRHKGRDDQQPQAAGDQAGRHPYDNQGRPGAGAHPFHQVKPNSRPNHPDQAAGPRRDTGKDVSADHGRAPAGRATRRGHR